MDETSASERERPAEGQTRYRTPTGRPCPRTLRMDGSVEAGGDCCSCGYCVLLEWAAWGDA
jgi:hypothetical protein